jgi:hypothetical protein
MVPEGVQWLGALSTGDVDGGYRNDLDAHPPLEGQAIVAVLK